MNISNITSKAFTTGIEQAVTDKSAASSEKESSGVSFNDMLNDLSESQISTDNLIQQLAAGEDVDIHQVMIAAEQTDINFQIALAIRDKLVESYQEIMRMNV